MLRMVPLHASQYGVQNGEQIAAAVRRQEVQEC
jgi:hypothetical protein